jgi:FkbM family methyltransferase
MLGHSVARSMEFIFDGGALRGFLSWPVFSLTSYQLVSRLVRQGIAPRTVLDVGANVGQFAVAVAMLMPQARIDCFEPLPFCAERLRANTRKFDRVAVHELALGNREGEVAFHVNSHSHSSSVLRLASTHKQAFPDAVETGVIAVKISTLDAIAPGLSLEPPILLKLDVQGYEKETLMGGAQTLSRAAHAVVECSFKPMYEGEAVFTDILRLMETHGFRFVGPVGWLPDQQTRTLVQIDALFERLAGNPRSAGGAF